MSFKKIVFILLNLLCPLFLTLSISIFNNYYLSMISSFFIIFFSTLFTILSIFLLKLKKLSISKFFLLFNILSVLIISTYLILKYNDYLKIFSSVNAFKNFILSTGNKGIFVYILIQMLQVVLIPVPATIIALAGALIYGPLLGSIYCSAGVLLGSFTSYFFGKVFGFKLVAWVTGKEKALKYANVINNRGKMFLPIAFLLPMFPDDILCWIAGITTMKFGYYAIVTMITRPIGVISMCYFGGGYIIPFYGWGLYVWAVLLVLIIAVVILTYKYQPQMEEWILNKLKNRKKRP